MDCSPSLPKYFVNGIGTSCVHGCSSNTHCSVPRQTKTWGLQQDFKEVHSGWALSCLSQAALLNEMPGGNLPTTEW